MAVDVEGRPICCEMWQHSRRDDPGANCQADAGALPAAANHCGGRSWDGEPKNVGGI
jgi:hypothetical protein